MASDTTASMLARAGRAILASQCTIPAVLSTYVSHNAFRDSSVIHLEHFDYRGSLCSVARGSTYIACATHLNNYVALKGTREFSFQTFVDKSYSNTIFEASNGSYAVCSGLILDDASFQENQIVSKHQESRD